MSELKTETGKKLKVILVGSEKRENIEQAINEVVPVIERLAHLVLVDKKEEMDLSKAVADLIILFGGDGSLLNIARRLNGNPTPVLGVNFGKFGFLAEYEFQEFLSDLQSILKGEFEITDRMLLSIGIHRAGKQIFSGVALNDLVISRSHFSRIIQVSLEINHQYCTRYHVDGLIISSPSGSTAHSLSAGGPIIHPALHTLVITPICPHTMTVRPLVVPGDYKLKLTLVGKSDTVAATIDGQILQELIIGDIVEITASKQNFKLVLSGRRTFYDRLRKKLHWSGHNTLD